MLKSSALSRSLKPLSNAQLVVLSEIVKFERLDLLPMKSKFGSVKEEELTPLFKTTWLSFIGDLCQSEIDARQIDQGFNTRR